VDGEIVHVYDYRDMISMKTAPHPCGEWHVFTSNKDGRFWYSTRAFALKHVKSSGLKELKGYTRGT